MAGLADRLKEALRFPTVSWSETERMDASVFTAFQTWLADSYPLCRERLGRELFGPWGILYHWPGKRADDDLILCAHYDVVPVDEGRWTKPPFGGLEEGGRIWGRGAIDDKSSLIAIMEAVEGLLAEGFVPESDVWLAFGGDEEVGGLRGAAAIAARLEEEGRSAAFLVDEGALVAEGLVGYLGRKRAALVGLSEKGYVNLRVSAPGMGGHASMPPRMGAARLLARAIDRLERHPFPSRLIPTVGAFLKASAAAAPARLKPFLSHPRLFWPFIRHFMARNPRSDALIRTSQAITMLRASDKENVLPPAAEAVVNLRILPGESVASVLARYRRLLSPLGVSVSLFLESQACEPMREGPASGGGWSRVEGALSRAFPGALVLPFLVTAGTDTKHYGRVARDILRIVPIPADEEALSTVHSEDESIRAEDLPAMLSFYRTLIRGGAAEG